MAIDEPVERPRRGRHVEARRNDWLVLDAAREVFAALGSDAPIAAVAERAGVGVGTLYRRYGSKTALLQRLCTLAMEQAIAAAESALEAASAWDGLADYVRTCVAIGSGALGALAGIIETTPEMWQMSRRSRALVDEIVVRAKNAGALRTDVTTLDVAWLIELFGSRGLARPGTEAENVRQRLLSVALDGLSPGHRTVSPLPGTPPSADYYEGRWERNLEPQVEVPRGGR